MSDKIFKVYEGTVDAFKATSLPTTYADRPVFIEGDASGNGRAIFANGEYYADTSEYAKIESFGDSKYVGEVHGLSDSQLLYALPSSQNGDEDDVFVTRGTLKTINGQSLIRAFDESGDITIEGGGSGSSAMPLVDHGTNGTTSMIAPNVFHKWGEVASLTLTLGAETAGVANQYTFEFASGSTATVLALPDSLKWADDNVPTIEPNMIYQISILNGLAVALKFKNAKLITNNLTVSGSTLTFDYPVASRVEVQVKGGGSANIVLFEEGAQTKSVMLGPGVSVEEVSRIVPIEDSVYKYVYNA